MKDRLSEKILYLKNLNEIKSVKTLASLIDIPYSTLKDIIDGISTDIRLQTAKKICDFFDLTLDELLRNEIELPEFILNNNSSSVLKYKRKVQKSSFSISNDSSINELNEKYDKNLLDLSDFTEEEKELIFKIIELNKKNKNNKG